MPNLKPFPPKMRQLVNAMRLTGEAGQCFHRAAAFVLDVPAAVLVMATFRAATPEERERQPNASATPFIHCFAEWQGQVFAPTLIEASDGELRPIEPDIYYAVNGAHDFHRLTRAELLRLDRKFELKRAIRLGQRCRGDIPLGSVLLDAAGVSWGIYRGVGIVPAYVSDED